MCYSIDMIEDPRQRIFHVDTECYIVYLGTGPDDYRPFLRIGNSPHLPEKVKHFISAVVVSDSLTGNQLIEHENLQLPLNGETRYIGDPVEVNKLKQFLEEKDLPVEGYEYEEVEDILKKGGAFVYFYKNGNLHIVHNAQGIFDLHTRERDDGHFVSRVERVVQSVKANPFRYLPRDLAPPGFLTAGERLYFFRDGRLGTVGITPDYIVDLGRYGIDPDLLLWLVEDRLSEGLLNRFKRATVTKKDLRVATSELQRLQNAVSLFTESGLSCIVAHLEAGESKVFSGYTIERRDGGVAISFPEGTGFPGVVFPSTENADIPNSIKNFLKKLGYRGKDFFPISGIPYLILDRDERDAQSLIRTYLRDMINELKDIVQPSNGEFLKYFEVLCRAVLAPESSSGANPLYDGKAKKNPAPRSPEFEFIYWNVRELSRLWERRKGVPAGVKKHGIRLASLFPVPDMPEGNETKLPAVGEFIRFDGEWYLFYRWNGVLTKLKLLQAQKSFEVIEKLRSLYDENYFNVERERLLQFIEGLTDVPGKKRRKVPAENLGSAPETVPAESGGTDPRGRPVRPEAAVPPQAAGPAAKPAEGAATSGTSADRVPRKSGSPAASTGASFSGAAASGPAADPGRLFSGPSGGGKTGGRNGRVVFTVLAVLAAGGAVFLILRSCEAKYPPVSSPAKAESRAAPLSATLPPAPPEGPARVPSAPEKQSPPTAEQQTPAETPVAEGPKTPQAEIRTGGEPPRAETSPGRREAPSSAQVPPELQLHTDGRPSQAAAATETVSPPAPGLDPEKIPITILDVFYLVNTIADNNGYRPLDAPEDVRPDPNWIYPGNSFKLPDSSVYSVVAGDTLWDIAILYIRKSIRLQAAEYNKIVGPYRGKSVPPEKKEETAAELRSLRDSCLSEELKEVFSKSLREIGFE